MRGRLVVVVLVVGSVACGSSGSDDGGGAGPSTPDWKVHCPDADIQLDGITSTADNASIYAGPSRSSAVVATLPEGTELQVVAGLSNDPNWICVSYPCGVGELCYGWGTGSGGSGGSGGGTGGGGNSGGTGGSDLPPSVVTISVVDALIAPYMANGTAWDGTGTMNDSQETKQAISELTTALGATQPEAAVAAIIGGIAMSVTAPPDAYGYLQLFTSGTWGYQVDLPVDSNQFHPQWPGAGWQHVPVDPNMRIRIALWDDDAPLNPDTIGTAEIGYNEIVNAAKSQAVWYVQTSHNWQSQPILYVGVSVTVEQ